MAKPSPAQQESSQLTFVLQNVQQLSAVHSTSTMWGNFQRENRPNSTWQSHRQHNKYPLSSPLFWRMSSSSPRSTAPPPGEGIPSVSKAHCSFSGDSPKAGRWLTYTATENSSNDDNICNMKRKNQNSSFQNNQMLVFEDSQPEWCVSSMSYSRDTPFWSETLELFYLL